MVEHDDTLRQLLERFASLEGAKILVHGGGRTATEVARNMGIETQMVGGRRITSPAMLRVFTMVYGGLVNKHIVSSLTAMGVKALGLTGADLGVIRGHRRPVTPEGVDYGLVGDVDAVDAGSLALLLKGGITPVVAPLTLGADAQLLNTNADTIASQVAKAMAGLYDTTLVFCFEKKGVLSDPGDEDSVIAHIDPPRYRELQEQGIVSGGMLPKLDNSFEALHAGVSRVVITRHDHLGDGGTTMTL